MLLGAVIATRVATSLEAGSESRALSAAPKLFLNPLQLGVLHGRSLKFLRGSQRASPRTIENFHRQCPGEVSWKMTAADAYGEYLKTLKPVKNRGARSFGPTEKPTSFVMKIVRPSNPQSFRGYEFAAKVFPLNQCDKQNAASNGLKSHH